jgi:hypothetical protein
VAVVTADSATDPGRSGVARRRAADLRAPHLGSGRARELGHREIRQVGARVELARGDDVAERVGRDRIGVVRIRPDARDLPPPEFRPGRPRELHHDEVVAAAGCRFLEGAGRDHVSGGIDDDSVREASIELRSPDLRARRPVDPHDREGVVDVVDARADSVAAAGEGHGVREARPAHVSPRLGAATAGELQQGEVLPELAADQHVTSAVDGQVRGVVVSSDAVDLLTPHLRPGRAVEPGDGHVPRVSVREGAPDDDVCPDTSYGVGVDVLVGLAPRAGGRCACEEYNRSGSEPAVQVPAPGHGQYNRTRSGVKTIVGPMRRKLADRSPGLGIPP